jgi:hypothetical protein
VRRFLPGFRIGGQEITNMEILNRAHWLCGMLKHLVLCAGFATAVAGSAWGIGAAVDSESAAQADWRTFMAKNPMPVGGCFHASYPSIVWKKVDCKMSPPHVHPTPVSHAQAPS